MDQAAHLGKSPSFDSSVPSNLLSRTPSPASLDSRGSPTITRDTTVLLALLLRVELVAVAFAAPVVELDALPLCSIKCPELYEGSAGALDYGEIAGRCGGKKNMGS